MGKKDNESTMGSSLSGKRRIKKASLTTKRVGKGRKPLQATPENRK